MSTATAAVPPGGGGTNSSVPSDASANAATNATTVIPSESAASTTTATKIATETKAETPRDTKNGVMQSFPPSHILEDGRLIYLPPPNDMERSRFFERSIARHEGEEQNDTTAPRVHPLAIASARLQSNGLNELNRAINLATLVQSREFFSYTNIVDPSFEAQTTVSVSVPAASKPAAEGGGAKGPSEAASAASQDTSTARRTVALFSLKRKRGQFEKASRVLERHEARLWAGIRAQRVIDRRLFQLRQQWRLVAPEHGTRAKLHAARTNEVIAVDVDVYDRDRVHGGNQALMGGSNNKPRVGLAGRLASRVPRFATIELRDDFRLPKRYDLDVGSSNDSGDDSGAGSGSDSDNDSGNGDETKNKNLGKSEDNSETGTGAVASSSAGTTADAGSTTNKATEKTSSQDQEMKDAENDKTEDKTKSNPDDKKDESAGPDAKGNSDEAVMEDAATTPESKSGDPKAPVPSGGDNNTDHTEDESYAKKWTRAEPYAVADPTLGRVIENFDPSKIPMLNLQLDIQKSSTGFRQSACLEPMTTLSSAGGAETLVGKPSNINNNGSSHHNSDEELLISLQHSLFCANLFESMRSELDPEPTPAGGNQQQMGGSSNAFSARRPKKALQSMAWLASESDENFVAPPSFLVGGDAGRGLAPLAVVHCHEGEVKVQLDSEYQLCLKLVEANLEQTVASSSSSKHTTKAPNPKAAHGGSKNGSSGSQSPPRLHAFCRALLLYAQDVYHRHSLYLHEREKKMRADEMAKGDEPRGLARIKKEDAPEKARILQSCVSLGSKMLFEQRIRKAISRVSEWVRATHGEKLTVEWLSLSIFDLHSKFTMYCRQLVVDGMIARDVLTVTKIDEETEDYRKVHFRTEKEFELYLKLELRRQMM
eukprot:jgi/Psemu1/287316/fgenesh1_pg.184_\